MDWGCKADWVWLGGVGESSCSFGSSWFISRGQVQDSFSEFFLDFSFLFFVFLLASRVLRRKGDPESEAIAEQRCICAGETVWPSGREPQLKQGRFEVVLRYL